jgi:hypothetical protein
MIVVRVSMVIQRGKREQAVQLLKERDEILQKQGVAQAARMYVRKIASAGSPEIIREYEFKNFSDYEIAWARRMQPTPDAKKWAEKFDALVVPGTMGYEIYELVAG